MGFDHWFSAPLWEGKSNYAGIMKQLDLSSVSHFNTSKSSESQLQSPGSYVKPKRNLADIELFKILIENQCEKSELLKDSVSFLRNEIEAKNKTIEKLTSFIINVIGDNFECVPNDDEHPKRASPSKSTPNKYANITTRRKTKSQGGIPDNNTLQIESISPQNGLSFEDSSWLKNLDLNEEIREPLQVRMLHKLHEIRREKHEEFIRLKPTWNRPGTNPQYVGTAEAVELVNDENEELAEKIDENIDPQNDAEDNETNDTEIGAWERHNTGFASKMMSKYGYQGKGLGKREDGIIEPIIGERKTAFGEEKTASKTAFDTWPKRTVLFAGDSMLNNVRERLLGKNVNVNVKVCAHPGATTQDMQHHLTALLRKQPSHLVLHVGTNDTPDDTKKAEDIYEEILELKRYTESLVQGITVVISCPIIRRDNNKANVKVIHLRSMLRTSGMEIISNENIDYPLLGKKGLHLSNKGVRAFAANMIGYLKGL